MIACRTAASTKRFPNGVIGERRGLIDGAARAFCLLSAVVLVVGLAAGCSRSKSGGAPRSLTPRSVPFLEGVAVPSGFKLIDSVSMDSQSAGQRQARHTYRGYSDARAVRSFYREQMPMLGWSCVSDQSFKGLVTIRFESKSEACTVQIEPGGGLSRTEINVEVVPFNRTPMKPPQRPVP